MLDLRLTYLSSRIESLQFDIAKGERLSKDVATFEQKRRLAELVASNYEVDQHNKNIDILRPILGGSYSTLSGVVNYLQSTKSAILTRASEQNDQFDLSHFAQEIRTSVCNQLSQRLGYQYLLSAQDYLSGPATVFSESGFQDALGYVHQDIEAFFATSGYSRSPEQFRPETISALIGRLGESSMSEAAWDSLWLGSTTQVPRVAKVMDLDIRFPNINDLPSLRDLMQILVVADQFDFTAAPHSVRKEILNGMLSGVTKLERECQKCLEDIGVSMAEIVTVENSLIEKKQSIISSKDSIIKIDLYAATIELENCRTAMELSYKIISQQKSLFLFKYI